MLEIIKINAKCNAYMSYVVTRKFAKMYNIFCSMEEELGETIYGDKYFFIEDNIKRFVRYIYPEGVIGLELFLEVIKFKDFFKQFEQEYGYEIEDDWIRIYVKQ